MGASTILRGSFHCSCRSCRLEPSGSSLSKGGSTRLEGTLGEADALGEEPLDGGDVEGLKLGTQGGGHYVQRLLLGAADQADDLIRVDLWGVGQGRQESIPDDLHTQLRRHVESWIKPGFLAVHSCKCRSSLMQTMSSTVHESLGEQE